MKQVKDGVGVGWIHGKAEWEDGVGSWWACEARVCNGGKKVLFLRKVKPRSVYCCWQGGGKMSGTHRNATRGTKTSPSILTW